jgi:Polyketide cyclase / dehydrase and lipid transport
MDKLPQYPLLVKRTHRDIAVTLNTSIEAEKIPVFDFIAAEGVLPVVLTGYSPFLPAVVATSGNTGPWDRPGSSRLVHLKDGSTAVEEVTGYDRPDFFSYKSSKFTFALKYLATGATGEWWFTTDGAATKVRWTYTFKAKSWLAAMILPIFARFLWSGYMRVCFFNTEKHFANQATSGTAAADAVQYTKS